jgi:NADH-quinone oxidoreductase subunit M
MALSIPYLLTIITFLPLLGSVLVMLIPGDGAKKWLALATTIVTFLVSLLLWTNWQDGYAGMQFVEDTLWFAPLGIRYTLGVDGISLFLVLLTTFLMPIAVYFSILYVDKKIGAYMALMLLLETAMIGVFLALDLVLFFVFFEASLIPMYFLIGEWGGQNRVYAAVKFFLYTFAGSALMVVAILIVYFSAGTFDIIALQSTPMPAAVQTWAFLAFSLAFAVKTPLFPFHTWLPDAHVQAPTAGSIILAGVLLKMGTYGFLRLAMPVFPTRRNAVRPAAGDAGGHRHSLRRASGADAKGFQVAGRLQFGGASRLRHARRDRDERPGRQRFGAADGESRAEHRRPVPHGRPALRTPPHAHVG